jgi:hypothetical protein
MKTYLKSLFPWRWIYPFIFIIQLEILFLFIPEYFIIFSIFNVLTWFVVDYSFGLGREERNVYKNIFGFLYLICILLYLWFSFKNK